MKKLVLVHEIWHFAKQRNMYTPCQGKLCSYCDQDDIPEEKEVDVADVYPWNVEEQCVNSES